jgi:hypothetical protein
VSERNKGERRGEGEGREERERPVPEIDFLSPKAEKRITTNNHPKPFRQRPANLEGKERKGREKDPTRTLRRPPSLGLPPLQILEVLLVHRKNCVELGVVRGVDLTGVRGDGDGVFGKGGDGSGGTR